MKNYFKYLILLVIVIIGLLLAFLFGKANDNKVHNGDSEVIKTLSKDWWFKIKSSTYDSNNKLLDEEVINDTLYLSFSETKIGVCDVAKDDHCEYYDYRFNEEKMQLFIDLDGDWNDFLVKDTYDIELFEKSFTLTHKSKEKDKIEVFMFEHPYG